jgi:hypothetical protein
MRFEHLLDAAQVWNKAFMLSRTGNKVQSGGGRLPMHK